MTLHPARRRVGAGWAGTILAAAVLCAATRPGASTQRATAESRDRHVFLTALDRSEVPITDLTLKEVVVKEDGAVREIVSVARATAPMQIALLIDDSQAAQALTTEVRRSVSAFVQLMATTNPDSAMSVWTFGDRPTKLVDFTTSASVVTRAVGSFFPQPGSGAYMMEALLNASTELKARAAARPVIVAFVVEDGPEFSTASEQTVTSALKNAGATLWTVVLQGHAGPAQGTQVEARDRSLIISDGATASGGGAKIIIDRLGLESAYAFVATRLTSQLDVTYARPDRLIPPKKLDVTVTRPGVKVLAPHWTSR